ncbi:MAG: asparagine synthase (glutamine-hydrolyzing) [Nitrospiraceae bacterium]|nr:MAG: asparagine synthase (glutamine-hydrolyzing) [Nitrospiraceae bacterium]
MCGICGYLNFDGKPVDQDSLLRMRDSMHHRGPDDAGIFMDELIGLGHRRLSIIDLAGGHQPMTNEDGSVIIVYNGEVYNFQELRQPLIDKGHAFKTRSDTEVIIHLYEEKGVDCVEHLRGMFAFAIWDKKKRELFIARDRLGVKPLYYYQGKAVFLFASEIKSLLLSGQFQPEIDESGLYRLLKYRFVYGRRTMFKGVSELLPGHYMTVNARGTKMTQYWNITPRGGADSGPRNIDRLKDELVDKLEKSVRLRMISDVPLGVFLSGGVDSSMIAALMSRYAENVKTFSIGFIPEEVNELKYAKIVADYLHADHHEYFLESGDFFSLLKKLIWHHDEPLIFPASIPLYILSKNSKNGATVMLSGEGSDEIFAGYTSNIKAGRLNKIGSMMPPAILKGFMKLPVNSKYKAILNKMTLNEKELIHSFFQICNDEQISHMYSWSDRKSAMADTLDEEIGFNNFNGPFLDKLIYFQVKTYLIALLMKQDKMSMAASIETRVPYLDHLFVELAIKIPASFKIKRNQGKYIFKKSCEKVLPESIVYREKMGFPVPIDKWFREKNSPFMEVLLDSDTKRNSFLNYKVVENTLNEFLQGNDSLLHQLWSFINIELWRREFFKT